MDFLILYEHREREFENACVLKYILQNKGYKVKIMCIYSTLRKFLCPKVIIVPHLYDDKQVNDFLNGYFTSKHRVINLQYEQLLSYNGKKARQGIPTGLAVNATHIAWGDDFEKYYLDNGIEKNQIAKIGNISMDMNLPKYNDLYYKKNDILKKYNVKKSYKKICLFISSFGLCNYTDELIRELYNNYEEVLELKEVTLITKDMIVSWIITFLETHKDYCFIYRPHPSEIEDKQLLEIEKKTENFYIIREESIRQWIKIADYCCTWFSTSIFDSYFALKYCSIIRPINLNSSIDVPLMNKAVHINDYQSFCDDIKKEHTMKDFPIKKDGIEYYYSTEFSGNCFEKLAELCISKINTQPFNYKIKTTNKFIVSIKSFIIGIMFDLSKYLRLNYFYEKKSQYSHLRKEIFKINEEEKERLKRMRFNNEK